MSRGFYRSIIIILLLVAPFFHQWSSCEEAGGALDLTLDQALDMAIRFNPHIEQARLEWSASQKNETAEWGQFEPVVKGSYDFRDLNRQNSAKEIIEQLGNRDYTETSEELAMGLEGKVLTGGSYQLGLVVNKKKSTYAIEHEYNSNLGVTIEQPLLKGATNGAPGAGIGVAHREMKIAFNKYRKQLLETVTDVETAYWNLVYTQDIYGLSKESVEIAKKTVKDSEERVKTGKMSQLDLVEAQAGLSLREISMDDSLQDVINAMTELKVLISDRRIKRDKRLNAVDALVLKDKPAPIDKASLDPAIKNHPDYIIRRMELERDTILYNYQKDQSLPELDFSMTYSLQGLGKSLEDSLKLINDQKVPTWICKIELKMPLFTGISQANKKEAARLKKEAREKQFLATEYELANSIALILSNIESLSARVKNTGEVVAVKKRILDVELSRLEAGYSTSKLVFEAEEELFAARQKELETILRYKIALSRFALVTGTGISDKNPEKRSSPGK